MNARAPIDTGAGAAEVSRASAGEHDAIVVGGGPAGASTAILLARAGWRVALVERRRFPRRKVCGECLAASNLPLLETLGVVDEVLARAGAELRHVTLMHGARETTAALPAAAHPRYAWGRALGREALDDVLLARARREGVDVRQPMAVRAIRGRAGAWTCELRAPGANASATLAAPVLVDAHGSWEALPSERAAPAPAHARRDLLAFKASFTGGRHPAGRISVLALDGGYGGMVVGEDGVTTLAGCVRRERLDALRRAAPGLRAGDVVGAWFARECAGVAHALDGAERQGAWLASGPLRPGIRVGLPDGILRVGNAGAEAHPILGEGMSMALQSGALLAASLSAARSPRAAIALAASADFRRRHAAAWRRAFAPRLHLAAAFAHAAMRPASARAMLALATRWPALLTHGARRGGKTRPLAVRLSRDASPRPVAPDTTGSPG